jgi:tetratricopeptide (TPR) repeat protein
MEKAQTTGTVADMAVRQQVSEGFVLLQQGQLSDAAELSNRLVASHGGNAEVLFLASEVQLAMDDPESALGYIAAAVDAAPGQWPLLLKKADNLIMLRRRTHARLIAEEAAAAAGDNAQGLWEIGKFYSKCGDPVSACRLYQQARAGGDSNPGLLYDLATAQFFTGDVAGAEKNLAAFLVHAPRTGYALYLRSIMRKQTEESNHVAELQSRLAAGFPNVIGRAECLFALAKELEDLGQADESFSMLAEATALKHQTLTHDVSSECTSMDAIRATYTSEVMQAEMPGHDEEGAIFIVGMPRTGTTLVERMLGRHSAVKSAGELLDFGNILAAAVRKALEVNPGKTMAEASLLIDFAELGREYMRSARQAAFGSPMFIDKMPINFMYCGLIKKALPNARIIHLVRDPMDSCYAVYKTLFNQAYLFSYDFAELAAYYSSYHRLMRHWRTVMPGAILDVQYEELVADTEAQARRMLAWCGLDWQAAVLRPSDNKMPATTASAAQVREPIYTSSVQNWRRYESHLAPLKAHLMAAGIVDAKGRDLTGGSSVNSPS